LRDSSEQPGKAQGVALAVLVGLAVLAPWPFGCVQPEAVRTLTLATLVTASVTAATTLPTGLRLPALPLAPVLAFLAVGLLQLVPLPLALHGLLAPGSSDVWHPPVAPAAAILGPSLHPLSVHPDATWRSLAFTVGLVGLALLAAPALSRPGAALWTAAAVAAGGTVLAAYAIFARARFGPLVFGLFEVPTVSPFGPFVSKNHFAGYVDMAALLTLGLHAGLRDRERDARDWAAGSRALPVVFALVAVMAMVLAVLASASRGGAVSLAAGALAFAILRWARRAGGRSSVGSGAPRALVSLGFAAALGALLLVGMPRESQERIATLAGASFRVETWKGALRLTAASPWLGSGLGSFEDAYPRFKRGFGDHRVEHAENDYLEALAEAGLFGWLLALAALCVLVRAAWRERGRGSDSLHRGIGAGALAGLCALAVHSVFDFNLRIPSNALLAVLLAAIAASAAGLRPVLSGARTLLAACVPAVLIVVVAGQAPDPWPAAKEKARQVSLARTRDVETLRLDRAEAALRAVVQRRPALAEAWLLLGGSRMGRDDGADGLELARHSITLDPERPDLAAAVERLTRWHEARTRSAVHSR
jgi:O-antigen ligase